MRVTSAAKILDLERRLAARERELAARLAGKPEHGANRARPVVGTVGFIVLAVSLVGAVSSINARVVADDIPSWVHHAFALAIFAVFATILIGGAVVKWRVSSILILLVPIFIAGGLGADLPSQLNRFFDRSPRTTATVRVLSVSSSKTSKQRHPLVVLESWRDHGCMIAIERRSRSKTMREGDLVTVVRGRGFFGWEWIETIEPAKEPGDP